MIETIIILGTLFIAGIMTFIIRHIYKREWARKASKIIMEIQEEKGVQIPQKPSIRELQDYVEHLREIRDGRAEDEENDFSYSKTGGMYQ